MAIVVFRCDTCKRTVEVQQNPDGLEIVQRCTITHGCRGKLFQQEVLLDFVRGQLPDPVVGLDDWIPRKVLHNHAQPIQRDEWIIIHNMGTNPAVSVFVNRPIEGDLDRREEITPETIEIVDDNTIILRFDREWSGIAQLVARQSDPDLLRPRQRAVESTSVPQQLSATGTITVATNIGMIGEPTHTSFNVQYDTSSASSPVVTYTADDQPSIRSPWLDFNKVIIRGQIYTVRSFYGIIPEMASGVINSGSNFRFTEIDPTDTRSFREIQRGEVLLLLANAPYERVDKRRDVFVDVTSVTSTENKFSFFYDTGEFFTDENVIQNVYPLVRPV